MLINCNKKGVKSYLADIYHTEATPSPNKQIFEKKVWNATVFLVELYLSKVPKDTYFLVKKKRLIMQKNCDTGQ